MLRRALASLVAAGAVLLAVAPPAPAAPSPALRALAGAHVVAPLPGPTPGAAFLRRVRRGQVGGVIVFSASFASRAGLVRSLAAVRAAARAGGRPTPLVVVDQEGGTVRRLPWAAPESSAAVLAALGPDALRAAGRDAGRDLRAVGIHVDLAPVADVGWPGAFLGSRALGATPPRVAAGVDAFVHGLRSGRAAAALKHFPGLGRAGVSTDGAPVVIHAPRRQLARDLVPFQAGVRAGARLVMVASAIYPALDPARVPAVLSRRVVSGLLRGGLGFDGVVITDALDTPALAQASDVERRAILAGVDLLLYGEAATAGAGAERLATAAAGDPVLQRRLAASARRLHALRARLGVRA